MTTQAHVQAISRIAGADLSALQYHFGKLDANDQIIAAGAGDVALVITQENVAGRTAGVAIGGMTKVVLGGTVGPMVFVKPDANQEAVAAAAGEAYSGLVLVGGVAGDIVSMLVVHGHAAA